MLWPRTFYRSRHLIALGVAAIAAAPNVSTSLYAADPAADVATDPNAPQPIAKIIQFGIEGGNLATRTALHPTAYMRPIDVADLPGTTRVEVRMRSRRDRPAMALYFRLTHVDGEIEGDSTQTTLYSRPGYIEISRSEHVGDTILTTTLTQMPENPASGGDTDEDVVLKVRRLDTQTSRVVEETTIPGSTLLDLMRRHPRETAEFMAPLFRTFHQEQAIMGVDLLSAWQVLADVLKPDDSLRPTIESLVKRLGADDFREREAALAEIRKMGGPAALVLLQWPRAKLSAEQISRIQVFLRDFAPLSADEAVQRRKDVDFLLNCVAYSDDPAIRRAAAGEMSKELRTEVSKVAQEPDALKRSEEIDKLRKTLPPRDDPEEP